MIEHPGDRRLATGATGLLREFNRADVLAAADVHVATRLGELIGPGADHPDRETVLLAAALAVRAVRHGSVCVDLADIASLPLDVEPEQPLPWPEPTAWIAAVAASPLVEQEALQLSGSLLYLDRYWREEEQVCADLLDRLDAAAPPVDEPLLAAGLERVFPASFADKRSIAEAAVRRGTTVLTGGPGTGKTTTVARLLALIAEQHEHATGRLPRIAMCAPTAKAAARLTEAVAEQTAMLDPADRARLGSISASTLHRLLGTKRWGSTRFAHDRFHRLPHDIVVVDETSMVALTQMARLLEAVRPDARLILVGDPDQLASVEAGAVLADVVDGLADHPTQPVARLDLGHRFDGAIAQLAVALRAGDAEAALEVLRGDDSDVELIDPANAAAVEQFTDDVVDHALSVWRAADAGDADAALAALDQHRLLCAHREGPFGVRGWNQRVERLLADRSTVTPYAQWYAGRPVIVTANHHTLGIYNGDIGVTVRTDEGRLAVAIATTGASRRLAVTRLPDTDTLYAMTVHKAQGSQAQVVSVVMPPTESTLLTRELFYTAVTRAQRRVRIVGTEDSVRAAIAHQALRASGLAARLRTPRPHDL